jgi:hypothetical protein
MMTRRSPWWPLLAVAVPFIALTAGLLFAGLPRPDDDKPQPRPDAPAGVVSAADYPRRPGEPDDTARLRRFIADACKLDGRHGPGGAAAHLPPGVYTVSDTLELYNVGTLVLRGERMASRIVYTGPPGKPVFDLVQTYRCRVEDLYVCTRTPGTLAAFRVCNRGPNDPPATWTTTTCEWWHVWVEGVNGGDFANAWDLDTAARGGPDANSEHHRFQNCTASGYVNAAWRINGYNVHGCFWDGCEAVGFAHDPPSGWCVDAARGSYVRWRGGYTKGHGRGVFHLGGFQMLVDIDGHNSEGERLLVSGDGPMLAGMPVTVRNCRFDGVPPPELGGAVVWLMQPGPLTFNGNRIVGLGDVWPKVCVFTHERQGGIVHEGNFYMAVGPGAGPPTDTALLWPADVPGFHIRDSRTNVYQDAAGAVRQFGTSD